MLFSIAVFVFQRIKAGLCSLWQTDYVYTFLLPLCQVTSSKSAVQCLFCCFPLSLSYLDSDYHNILFYVICEFCFQANFSSLCVSLVLFCISDVFHTTTLGYSKHLIYHIFGKIDLAHNWDEIQILHLWLLISENFLSLSCAQEINMEKHLPEKNFLRCHSLIKGLILD